MSKRCICGGPQSTSIIKDSEFIPYRPGDPGLDIGPIQQVRLHVVRGGHGGPSVFWGDNLIVDSWSRGMKS